MESFKNFISSLKDKDKEIFDLIILDITHDSSEKEINSLNEKLKEVRKEIDIVNLKRQHLSQLCKRCEDLTDLLNKFIESNKKNDNIVLDCLIIYFNSWVKELKDEILYLKPNSLLQTKYKLRRDIDNRIKRNEFMTKIIKDSNNA